MRVVGLGGQHVGFVKHIESQRLVVGRPSAPDIYVPLTACRIETDGLAILEIPAGEVESMRWTEADDADLPGWQD
jgi:hypothetical protein